MKPRAILLVFCSVGLAACSGGGGLSTASILGGGSGAEAAAAAPAPPSDPMSRALNVGMVSARAAKCGYNFDPAKLKANYFASEAALGTSPQDMAKVEQIYNVAHNGVAKAAATEPNYCSEQKTKQIKEDLTKLSGGRLHAAGAQGCGRGRRRSLLLGIQRRRQQGTCLQALHGQRLLIQDPFCWYLRSHTPRGRGRRAFSLASGGYGITRGPELQQLLWIETLLKLAGGLSLLLAPVTVIRLFGLPASNAALWPRLLGAVLVGLSAATYIEGAWPGSRGLGLAGCIVINLCGSRIDCHGRRTWRRSRDPAGARSPLATRRRAHIARSLRNRRGLKPGQLFAHP